ncbi:unnamed protein product, partial [Amoebophrya sp. A25]
RNHSDFKGVLPHAGTRSEPRSSSRIRRILEAVGKQRSVLGGSSRSRAGDQESKTAWSGSGNHGGFEDSHPATIRGG